MRDSDQINFDVWIFGCKVRLLSLEAARVSEWAARHLWRIELRRDDVRVTLRPLGHVVFGTLEVACRLAGV
jgi:hypothetical protein